MNIRKTVFTAMFTALIALGAWIAVPIGPVPIVLQNFFVLLAALLLGERLAISAVGIYLLAGMVGLPVFSGGGGGIAHLIGPTGGFLLAYLPAAFVTGWINRKGADRWLPSILAVVAGILIVYLAGVPWLKFRLDMSWTKAFSVGMLPFLLWDGIKGAAAVAVARILSPVVRSSLEK